MRLEFSQLRSYREHCSGCNRWGARSYSSELDVPLPDVVGQALDRLVEPLPQQPGAEGFDLDGGVRVDAFAQALLADSCRAALGAVWGLDLGEVRW